MTFDAVEMDRAEVVQQKIADGNLFTPTYRRPWSDIWRGATRAGKVLREFWFKGGRASFKSTFVTIVIVLGMMWDARCALKAKQKGNPNWKKLLTHAVIYRKHGVDIKDSTYETVHWVITELLGYGGLWHFSKTGRRAIFMPTGQQILFRGLDDPQKSKSIKAPFGFFKYLWFEELTEYDGMKEIRSVGQSVKRGGHHFLTFCTYNPPMTPTDWVNEESLVQMEGRAIYHSTFLDAAKWKPEWLGEDFFRDAKALLVVNEMAFRHEYLGEIVGTGLEIFSRVKVRTITKEEREAFKTVRYGLDFGFENDPCALMSVAYDKAKDTIYIFGEFVKHQQFEEQIYAEIVQRGIRDRVLICDSAEPKAIARLQQLGVRRATKCYKAAGYNDASIVWMRKRNIVIDPHDCPEATREFTRYAFDVLRDGRPRNDYPDRDNHTIDATRYALEDLIRYGETGRLVTPC